MTEHLLVFFAYILLFGLIFYYAAQYIYLNKRRKILFSICTGFFLSVVVTLFDHDLPTYKQGESMVLSGESVFNNRTRNSLDFVRKNMTFVDISRVEDSVIYKDPVTGRDVRITDRKKLSEFIRYLDSFPGFRGILVLDLAFDIESRNDSVLKSAIDKFSRVHQLVLASGSHFQPVEKLTFADSLYGDVTEKLYSKKCFSHELIKDNGNISLPFKVYSKLQGITSYSKPLLPFTGLRLLHSGNSTSLFVDHLLEYNSIPFDSLDVTGNDISFEENSASGINTVSTSSPIKVYELGALMDQDRVLFEYDEQIKSSGNSFNIVIVGSFDKKGNDSHATLQSEMVQGVLILSSLIENLLNTRAMNVSRFWCFLFLCFTIITLFVTFQSFKKENAPKEGSGFNYFVSKVFKIIFWGEIHFWLLFIMMVFILNNTGRLMNIISLYVFYIAMELIFKAWGKRLRK
ncbi:MAG: hypothetical protein ABI763_00480 [Bacteroidota bacterium]